MQSRLIRNSMITLSMATAATVAVGLSQTSTILHAQEVLGTYQVQAGEGLYGIATKHGMTLNQLKQLNGLTNNLIYPGQSLKVYQSAANQSNSVNQQAASTNQETSNQSTDNSAASPRQSNAQATNRQGTTYIVRAGDSLYQIASRHGIQIDQLKAWNGLNSNFIYPGQVLSVSQQKAQAPANPASRPANSQPAPRQEAPLPRQGQNSANTTTYRVQAGDYLNRIAGKFNITVNQLKAWNGLNSDFIYPGQVLKVSQQQSAPSNPQESSRPAAQPRPSQVAPSQSRPVAANRPRTYRVQAGNSLNQIAAKFNISIQQLKEWNGLRSNLIHPNQVLRVAPQQASRPQVQAPAREETQARPSQVAPSQSRPVAANQPTTYRVQAGDYLNRIAAKFNISVQQLKEWNGLRSNLIHPNQVLRVAPQQASRPQVQAPAQEETQARPSQSNQTKPNQSNRPTTYRVQAGDYLNRIAGKFNITVNQLKAWNGLNSDFIYPGQVLKVAKTVAPAPAPQAEDRQSTASQNTQSPTVNVQQYYTIKPGDSVHKIARQHGITVAQLKAWNQLTSNYIYAGKRLLVSKPVQAPAQERPQTNESSQEQTQADTSRPSNNQAPSVTVYTVKAGDSLWAIANKHGATIDQIKTWNRLSSNFIHAGQKLRVADPRTTTSSSEEEADLPLLADRIHDQGSDYGEGQVVDHLPMYREYYKVRPGDSVYKIAKGFNLSVDELKNLNHLTSNYIWPGQELKVAEYATQQKVRVGGSQVQNHNVNNILDIARSQLGVTKYSPEHLALVKAYNSVNPKPLGYTLQNYDDWCDAFVTYLADKAGLSHLTGREVGVERHKKINKEQGIWKGLVTPKPGDLVFYNWNGSRTGWGNHIGIVESLMNNKITTIEGNTALPGSDQRLVARKVYDWNSKYIQGYARPNY